MQLTLRLLCLIVAFATATEISFDTAFNRQECLARTLRLTSNGSLPLDDEAFFRDPAGQPLSHRDNLTLTMHGCEKLCGRRHGWYTDIGPRLSAWLIPILLLISNVELSPLDKRKFLAILHLLGDPLDSIWSLIHKIDSWDRCYDMADQYQGVCEGCKQVIATVFAGFEEIEGPLFTPDTRCNAFVSKRDLATHFEQWRRTAVKLADSRTNEFPRTCLAILLYLYQLVAVFVNEVGGGNSSPPGGRIATGVLLSWLIPTALLSNAVGNFPSRRTCYDIIYDFAKQMNVSPGVSESGSVRSPPFSRLSRTCTTGYFDALGWSGGIHSFRPWKSWYAKTGQGRLRAQVVFGLAFSPVCISMVGAFILLWVSLPVGLNCRHTWVIGISLAWLTSASLTRLSYSARLVTGKQHWYLVLTKDFLIAAPSLAIIFLSACGLFNSCYCWSGSFYYGENAHVLLNSDPIWNVMDHTVFPLIVGVCVALQLAMFSASLVVWRRGLKLFRWSERLKHQEWEGISDYKICQCMA